MKMVRKVLRALVEKGLGPVWRLRKGYPVDLTIVEPGISVTVPPPANRFALSHSLQAYFPAVFQTHDVAVYRLRGATVSPEGIVFNAGKVFEPALVFSRFANSFGPGYYLKHRLRGKHRIATKTPVALVFDHWSNTNYYHWVVDSLPRLLALESVQPDATVLLPPKPPAFVLETLKAFRFQRFYELAPLRLTVVPELVIPTLIAESGRQHPALIREVRFRLRHALSAHLPKLPQSPERVYVSRARQRRKIANEPDVLDVVRRYGFAVIFFEDLGFWEQVAVLRNTKIFLTTHGANLTNLLFLPEGAIVVEMGNDQEPNPCYHVLAGNAGRPYYYIPCASMATNGFHLHNDLLADKEMLEETIKTILAEPFL